MASPATRRTIASLRNKDGNSRCFECNAHNPAWASVKYVLAAISCLGLVTIPDHSTNLRPLGMASSSASSAAGFTVPLASTSALFAPYPWTSGRYVMRLSLIVSILTRLTSRQPEELERMRLGGNSKLQQWFDSQPDVKPGTVIDDG